MTIKILWNYTSQDPENLLITHLQKVSIDLSEMNV